MALEATSILGARACAFHRVAGDEMPERLALHSSAEMDETKLKLVADHLATEVVSSRDALAVTDLAERYAGESWFDCEDLQKYLGIPLFDRKEELIGVASLFGAAREFGEEDEWWLRSAARLVADRLAYEKLEAKACELERRSAESETETSASDEADKQSAKSKFSILVVDDDRAVNDLICQYLSIEDYSVEAAFDGQDALRRFKPAKHDVLLTDMAMPLMNGWDLAAALRARSPELHVLLMTGYDSGNWSKSYLQEHGIHALLGKPLNFAGLMETLEGLTAR